MRRETLFRLGQGLLISVAIYPLVLVAAIGLAALGAYAVNHSLPMDMMPLVYGLAFATLTVALIDILGVASVIMALIACANLIEYAQLLVPGRNASAVDFIAGLSGVLVAAVLVWTARTLVERGRLAADAEGPRDPRNRHESEPVAG